MELRHLRYFVAVAEELSFRKAASRLSVSEPAVSQQVADLEDELGQKLFNRDSRRVELTEVGRVLLRGARRTLASATEAVAQAQEAAAGERGRLTIGGIDPLVHAFLPDALAKFRERFPLVEVTVLNMDDRTLVEALANGTIMLGIGWAGPNLAESQSAADFTDVNPGFPSLPSLSSVKNVSLRGLCDLLVENLYVPAGSRSAARSPQLLMKLRGRAGEGLCDRRHRILLLDL